MHGIYYFSNRGKEKKDFEFLIIDLKATVNNSSYILRQLTRFQGGNKGDHIEFLFFNTDYDLSEWKNG